MPRGFSVSNSRSKFLQPGAEICSMRRELFHVWGNCLPTFAAGWSVPAETWLVCIVGFAVVFSAIMINDKPN